MKKSIGHCFRCDKRTTRVLSRVYSVELDETVVEFECLECAADR